MKTDALIRALAADAARPVRPAGVLVVAAWVAGAAASCVLLLIGMQPRPDLASAWSSPGFCLKTGAALLLALSAARWLGAAARPVPLRGSLRMLALAPVLLLSGVLVELGVTPAEDWGAHLLGHNAPHCLALIPLLSLAPAMSLMIAFKRAAPAHPGLAGALIGLSAGGIGASLYALTCPDDSPLFVAAWYSFAVVFTAGACFIIGRRWLRW